MLSKFILLLCIALLSAFISSGQEPKKITGVVLAEDNGPLPGVTVTETDTRNSVLTDVEGKFTIQVSGARSKLTFSLLGFISREIAITGPEPVTVRLVQDVKQLREVIVIGYGTQKKSDLTGSISSVDGSDLEKLSSKRVDQALQGRAAGVRVINTDGAPGGKTLIRVRGSNSILGGNNALVVIDGLQGGDIDKLNPSDIESVQILKDASATAIYGSRGANGVLLITTKKGRSGKPVINYSATGGLQRVSHWLDLLSAGDYARNINAVRMLDNSGHTPVPVFTEEEIAAFDKNGGIDWQKAIYQNAAIQNHQLSVSGGTDKVNYFVSGGYLNQDGILINSGYKRYSLRSNINLNINSWLSAGINLATVKDEGKSPAFGGESGEDLTLQGAVIVAPRWGAVNPIYNEDGSYYKHPAHFGPADTWNPVASALEVSPLVKAVDNSVNANLDIRVLDGLNLNIAGFANVVNTEDGKFYNEKTKQGLPVDGKAGLGYLSNTSYEYYQSTVNLTYDKTMGEHHVNAIAVAEQSVAKFSVKELTASRFTSTQNGLNDLSSAGLVINHSLADKRTIRSYLSRINYSFRDRYLLTASLRADGSSVFGANNKWGYFPSMSVAWKLAEENFVKNANLFDELKVRLSIGRTGNQAIDPYQSLPTIISAQNYPWNGGAGTNSGFDLNSPGNPDLKWESTLQTNIGLDVAMFGNRLSATVDLYKKKTTNLLLYSELPTSSGFNTIIRNTGETQNKGLEIEITGRPLTHGLQWTSTLNFTINRNKVISLGETEKIPYITSSGGYELNEPLMNLVEGEPFGQMYGWGYEGTWSQAAAETARLYGQLPGDPKYTDLNQDTIIDINDLKVIGNALPKFIYGWSNRFFYKNFDLDFLVQGVYGTNVFNEIRIRLEMPEQATSTKILDRWTVANQDTDVPAYIDNATREAAGLTSQIYGVDGRSGRWVEDGSYLRLKTVALGYNLPSALLSKYGIQSLRIYLSATNLLTLTNYSGYDPEVSSYNESDGMIGVDFGNYPSSRTYSFGISVSF